MLGHGYNICVRDGDAIDYNTRKTKEKCRAENIHCWSAILGPHRGGPCWHSQICLLCGEKGMRVRGKKAGKGYTSSRRPRCYTDHEARLMVLFMLATRHVTEPVLRQKICEMAGLWAPAPIELL